MHIYLPLYSQLNDFEGNPNGDDETATENEVNDDETTTEDEVSDDEAVAEEEAPTPEAMAELEAVEVAILELEVLPLLTAEHLASLPLPAMAGFKARQIAVLPVEAMKGLTVAQVSSLTLEAVSGFHLEQIVVMSKAVREAFSEEQKAFMVSFITLPPYPGDGSTEEVPVDESTEEASVDETSEEASVDESTVPAEEEVPVEDSTVVDDPEVPTEEEVVDETSETPVPELEGTVAVTAEGEEILTEADIDGGIVDDSGLPQEEVSLTEEVEVVGSIEVDATDPVFDAVRDEVTGKVEDVNVIVYATYWPVGVDTTMIQPLYFMLDETGGVLPWVTPEGEETPPVTGLVPFMRGG